MDKERVIKGNFFLQIRKRAFFPPLCHLRAHKVYQYPFFNLFKLHKFIHDLFI